MRADLSVRQCAMKRRLQHEAAKNPVRSMGEATAGRRRIPSSRHRSRELIGKCQRREGGRSLRITESRFSEKHRQRLCSAKTIVAHWIEIEDQFITNIPKGESQPV